MGEVFEKIVLKNLEEEQKLEKKKKICADISENLKDDDPDF
jgi:hypothetical protein